MESSGNIIQFRKDSISPGKVLSTNEFNSIQIRNDEKKCGLIETQMKKVLKGLKNTKYPDTFDWSIYDRIANKFEETPRGGCVFNTTFKLVNHHSSCSKCHYAFEIDSYGRGCFHDCVYCYAKDQLETHGFWNRPQPFPVNLAEVRKVFYTVFETDRANKWRDIFEKRVPLRIGSMSDSFMYLDSKYGVTKELLRILNYYRYPYIIFTRSDLISHDDYMDCLDKNLCSIQFSISGNNGPFMRNIEPGAPSYKRRLKALKKLNESGYWTTVRINPLFPLFPDGYFTDPDSIKQRFGSKASAPKLPFYNDDFIPELSDAGVPSILAGFVRLSTKAVKNLTRATGVEVQAFFKPKNVVGARDRKFSDKEISYYYGLFHKKCQENQVRFSTCYIGNGIKDYYNYQHLWSNKTDCCDAKGNVKNFTKNTSQNIPWEERIRKSPCKQNAIAAKREEAEIDRSIQQAQLRTTKPETTT